MKLNIHLYIYARNENIRPYQDLDWTFTAALFRKKLEKKQNKKMKTSQMSITGEWMDKTNCGISMQ